jgi:hypothetical protein
MKDELPITPADSSREGNTTKPGASALIHPTPEPSAHPAPSLNGPNGSVPSSPPRVAAVIAKAAPSWTRTPPGEPNRDTRSDGAPSQSTHPPGGDEGLAYPSEQSHTISSPLERAASAIVSPSRPEPVSRPQILDRNDSHIHVHVQGNEGVIEREAKRAGEGVISDEEDRKLTTVSKEPEPTRPPRVAPRSVKNKPESPEGNCCCCDGFGCGRESCCWCCWCYYSYCYNERSYIWCWWRGCSH